MQKETKRKLKEVKIKIKKMKQERTKEYGRCIH
jgi:hypothetical protein